MLDHHLVSGDKYKQKIALDNTVYNCFIEFKKLTFILQIIIINYVAEKYSQVIYNVTASVFVIFLSYEWIGAFQPL